MTVAPMIPICPVANPLAECSEEALDLRAFGLGVLREGEVLTGNPLSMTSPDQHDADC